MSYRRLWIALGLVLTISFAVLSGVGIKVLKSAPPVSSIAIPLFYAAGLMYGQ
jgi:nitric oxide reductase large subunit